MRGERILLIGDSVKVKEFTAALRRVGAEVLTAPDNAAALDRVRADRPDGVVFILPVYWEGVADFVSGIRREPDGVRLPLIYLGDFIEASDQTVLKRLGVKTMTLGPVPTEEVVRFILNTVKGVRGPL